MRRFKPIALQPGSLHKGEDFFEVVFVLGGAELFFCEATGAFALAVVSCSFQCVERDATQGSEIFCGVAFARLNIINMSGIQKMFDRFVVAW